MRNSSNLFRNTKNLLNKQIRNITSTEYCLDNIRKFDYENFICTLLLKDVARSTGVAIRAFNVEISRIQDQTSDSKIGLMRMKFWEDAIERCFTNNSKIPNHPVILELNRILKSNKFTKRHLNTLIQSRKEIMFANSFSSIDAMEKYSEQSVSNIYYLILEGSGIRNVHADHAASHLGKAQGLCQLLRSMPINLERNFIVLPQQYLSEMKISHEDIIRGKNLSNIKECVFRVATRANQHLIKARQLSNSVPIEAKSIFLPSVVVDHFLQRLLKVDCDIFDKKLQLKYRTWVPVVWWKNLRKTY